MPGVIFLKLDTFYISAGPVYDPMPMGWFPLIDLDMRQYPREVQEALDRIRGEVNSAEELRQIAIELMKRR